MNLKTRWLMAIALGSSLALSAARALAVTQSAGIDPVAVATAFEDAVGSDAHAAQALLSPDATLTIVPPPLGTTGHWAGQKELEVALQYAQEHQVRRRIMGQATTSGQTVNYTALVWNDAFIQLGVAPVHFTTEVVVTDGRIASYSSTIVPTDQVRLQAAIQTRQIRLGVGGVAAVALVGASVFLVWRAVRRRRDNPAALAASTGGAV